MLAGIYKPVLIPVSLLIFSTYIIGFFRWKIMLEAIGLNLSRAAILRSYCIGFFFNLFFPSTIGGDLCRSADLSLSCRKPKQVVASVVLDRISGYTALVVIALVALLLGYRLVSDTAVFFALGIITAFLAGILMLLFNNFIFSKISKFLNFFGRAAEALSSLHSEIYKFRNKKKIISLSLIYSLIIQLVFPLIFYLLSLALATKINPLYFFIFVPLIAAISALPVSIGGLGLREAVSMFFFTGAGMPAEIAVTISLLSFFIVFLFGIAAGVIYIFAFPGPQRQHDSG